MKLNSYLVCTEELKLVVAQCLTVKWIEVQQEKHETITVN